MTDSNSVSNHSSDMQLNPLSNAHWLNQAHISTLIKLPWNQTEGIAADLGPDAMGMGFQTESPAQAWGPVLLRKRLSGGVFAISGKEIVAVDQEGQVVGRFNPPTGVILSLLDHQEDLLVLHNDPQGQVKLTCLDKDGSEKWSKEQKPESKHLLKVKGSIYVVFHPKNQSVSLQSINSETGETTNVFPTDSETSPVFAGEEGEICFLSYDPAANQRLWNRQLLGEPAVSRPIPSDMYGLFAFPTASDASSNAYGIFGMEAGKMAVDKSKNWRLKIEAMVPALDGSFWFSESNGNKVQLMHSGAGKVESTTIDVPSGLVEGGMSVQWRLVQVDKDAFYLTGLNPSTYKRMHLQCKRETGEVAEVELSKGPDEFGSILQGGRNWAFTAKGSLILPVATPEALVLVKVEL